MRNTESDIPNKREGFEASLHKILDKAGMPTGNEHGSYSLTERLDILVTVTNFWRNKSLNYENTNSNDAASPVTYNPKEDAFWERAEKEIQRKACVPIGILYVIGIFISGIIDVIIFKVLRVCGECGYSYPQHENWCSRGRKIVTRYLPNWFRFVLPLALFLNGCCSYRDVIVGRWFKGIDCTPGQEWKEAPPQIPNGNE